MLLSLVVACVLIHHECGGGWVWDAGDIVLTVCPFPHTVDMVPWGLNEMSVINFGQNTKSSKILKCHFFKHLERNSCNNLSKNDVLQ